MTSKIVVINKIEKETDKAILVNAGSPVWIPRSLIKAIYNDARLPAIAIEMPVWFWMQHRFAFSITTSIENINYWLNK